MTVGPESVVHVAAVTRDVVVTGTLPSGDTVGNVAYFIVDMTDNAIVGQIILPNAVKRPTAVSITVKVGTAGSSYAIGTFEADGRFHPAPFLDVESGARGRGRPL